jgi:hypothetical protein
MNPFFFFFWVSFLLLILGEGAYSLKERIDQVLPPLYTKSATVRLSTAVFLRCLATAMPSFLARYLNENLNNSK